MYEENLRLLLLQVVRVFHERMISIVELFQVKKHVTQIMYMNTGEESRKLHFSLVVI